MNWQEPPSNIKIKYFGNGLLRQFLRNVNPPIPFKSNVGDPENYDLGSFDSIPETT